jgi:hypothetical protein
MTWVVSVGSFSIPGSMKAKFCGWEDGLAHLCLTLHRICLCLCNPAVSSGLFKLKYCSFSRQAR